MTASMRCALAAILAMTPVAPVVAQEPITARVDRVFAAYDRRDSPGCALAVYRAGEIVYSRG